MNMTAQVQAKPAPTHSFTPVRTDLLQRKCACGGSPGVDGECEACRKKRIMLQRKAINAPGSTLVQTKLAISQPGDQYEQEADRVAEHVMRMPASTGPQQHGKPAQIDYPLMRQEAGSGLATTAAPPIVSEVIDSGNGRPLDDSARTFFEPRFGHNFSEVRVHTDTRAVKSAEAVNALAYTIGHNIVFGRDHYASPTTEGRKLLAHELTHVVQQARSQPLLQRQEKSKKSSSTKKKQKSSSEPTSKKEFPEKISCDRSIYVFVDAPVPYPITSTPDHPPVGPQTQAPLPSSVCGGAGKTSYQHFNPNIRYQRLSNGDQYWWEDVPQKDGAWQRHYTVRKAGETFCRFTYKPTTPCPSEVALKIPSEATKPMSESELMHGAIVREGWHDTGASIREFEDGAIETEDARGKIWTFIPNDDGTYFGFNNMDDTVIEGTTLDESMWDEYSFTR